MESVISRLISLLAHHPDYSPDSEDLIDFSRYISFYLSTVATPDNLSLIYHIAQRVKQCSDAIDPTYNENLYHLSDLAQLTIRKYEEISGWSVETLPTKIKLPSSIFTALKNHESALEIAERNYIPPEAEDGVEAIVRAGLRRGGSASKKRRSDVRAESRDSKRAKTLPIRRGGESSHSRPKPAKKERAVSAKTPKKARQSSELAAESEARRRSGRAQRVKVGYAESSDEEDVDEGEVASWAYYDEDGKLIKTPQADKETPTPQDEEMDEGDGDAGAGAGDEEAQEKDGDMDERKAMGDAETSTKAKKGTEKAGRSTAKAPPARTAKRRGKTRS